MARDAVQVPDGIPIENRHVQQLIASWLGLAGDGTDAQLAGIPLRQTSVKDPTLYAIDARNRGTGGKHIRATHSSGSPVLFDVTDAGVLLSVGGGAATNALISTSMILGWAGTAASIPSGYSIINASKNAFPYGANVDGDLGATGGSATYDVSHTHTSAAHTHATSATHVHTLNGHTHSLQNHTHQNSHNHNIANHTHSISTASGQTLGDGSFSSTDKVGSGANFDNNDTGHTHGLNHAHGGATGSNGTSPTGGSNTSTSDVPSNNVSGTDSSNSSATAPGTSDSTTPGATGTSGSATQSILPPFWRCYWIQRA